MKYKKETLFFISWVHQCQRFCNMVNGSLDNICWH